MEDEACMQAFAGEASGQVSQVGSALLGEGGSFSTILARTTVASAELLASPHSLAIQMVQALELVAARGAAVVANLAPCIAPGSKALFLAWGSMRTLAYSQAGGRAAAEGAVQAMASLLRHAKEVGAGDFVRVACDEELLAFLSTVAKAPCSREVGEVEGAVGEEAQEQVAAMCGIMGEAKHDTALAEGVVAVLAVSLQSPSLAVSAEALNSVFDMFSDDDDNDALFRSAGLLTQLQAYQPMWKGRVKQATSAASTSAETLDRSHEAALNLKRFIAYKRKMGHK
jgi:hypothetical protein